MPALHQTLFYRVDQSIRDERGILDSQTGQNRSEQQRLEDFIGRFGVLYCLAQGFIQRIEPSPRSPSRMLFLQ